MVKFIHNFITNNIKNVFNDIRVILTKIKKKILKLIAAEILVF